MNRLPLHGLDTSGANDGDVPTYDAATGRLVYAPGGSSGVFLGPENLQFDTIDTTLYHGQSDAGLRLDIPSHITSDEATHPSVLRFPEGWNGYRYWMAFTPYPAGNDAHEDPCIAASQDGTHWETPAGFTNPLDNQPGGTAHNSDTELAISPDGSTLHCLWRTNTGTTETLYVRSTTDGVTWTVKQSVLTVSGAGAAVLSPTLVHDGSQWVMWSVNGDGSPNVIERRTAAAVTGPWSAPTQCSVTGAPAAGRDLWHLAVIRLGGQYVALLNDCTRDVSGTDGKLYLMRSTDGLSWTCGPEVMGQALSGNYGALYRGSIVPTFDNGRLEFDVWHGAWTNGATPRWGIYYRRLAADGGAAAAGLTVQDEGVDVATDVTRIDFQGAGVTAGAGSGEIVVTIPGSSSSAPATLPLTTTVNGVPELVWGSDDSLIATETP